MDTPHRLLVLGDSVGATVGGFAERLTQEYNPSLPITVVVNDSVPSSTIVDVLDRAQERLPDEHFDCCLLFVGINDTKHLVNVGADEPLIPFELFVHRYEMLLHRLVVDHIQPIVCGLPPLDFIHISTSGLLHDRWYWDEGEYLAYNDAIESMAATSNAVFIDLAAAFSSTGEQLFGDDGVHPNKAGHQLIEQTIVAKMAAMSY